MNKGIFRFTGKGILPSIDPGTVRERAQAVEKEKELDVFLGQSSVEWDCGRIAIHQGSVYYLPEGPVQNLSLRFLRTRLLLDEFKEGQFEPSQALTMSMKAGRLPNTVSFPTNDNQVLCYLKGEIVSLEVDGGSVRGWCLAAMEGFPPGWAKGTGMNPKNKYYPGRRWQQQSGPEMAVVKQAVGGDKTMTDKGRKNGPIRLDRSLTEMGYGTCTQVRDMVKKGWGRVNAKAIRDANRKMNPESNLTEVDRSQTAHARMEHYMFNRPQGVVSATEDRKYPTVMGFIREALGKDLFPVGRLDIDTEGLLLITNDGGLAHNLLLLKKHVYKVHLAHASGGLPGDAVRRSEEGVKLEGSTMTLPAELKIQEAIGREKEWQEVLVTTREGEFHQTKWMFEALGYRVGHLKRISMGPLTLDPELKPGEHRPLTPEEKYFTEDCRNRRNRVQLCKSHRKLVNMFIDRGKQGKMKLNRKKAVIFGSDGTLMGSMWMWKAVDIEHLARLGLICPDDPQKEIEGMGFPETAAYFKEWFQLEETLDEIKSAWIQISIEKYRKKVSLKLGAGAFLEFTSGKGLAAGIATSNGRAMVDAVLGSLNTRRYLKAVVTVCEVAAGKPVPDIYLNVAECLQVAPEDCAVFEDTPAGIQAGKSAGMTVSAVEDVFSLEMKEEKEKLTDYYTGDYYELLDGATG